MDIDLIHKELEKKDWKIEELGQFDYALIADVAEIVEKQFAIHVVMPRLIANQNYSEHQVPLLVDGKEYKALCKNKDCYCVIDENGDMEVFHKSFFNVA